MTSLSPQELADLSQVGMFADVPRDVLARLTAGARIERFSEGAVLFEQGDRPEFVHVLLSGSVELWGATKPGKQALIEVIRPVDAFILAAALTGTPYLMQARVNSAARLLLLPAASLRAEIAASSDLAIVLLGSLAGQFRRMVRQVKNLKLRASTQRVGCFLLGLAADPRRATAIRLPYDKHLIASELGMTRENLSRTLAQLRALGVRTRGATVFIDDPARLRAFCRPDALIDGGDAELRVRPAGDGAGEAPSGLPS